MLYRIYYIQNNIMSHVNVEDLAHLKVVHCYLLKHGAKILKIRDDCGNAISLI